MAPSKKVLMLCGDYMEDYEAAVPFYALAGLGVAVHCAAPGKAPGDPCPTAVHDFLGYDLYTELPGHRFRVTADFAAAAADPSSYDALVVPGGRFVEQLSVDPEAVALVGVPMRVISNLAGAVGVEAEGAVADGKLVTAASWPDLAEFIAHLVDLLGITVSF
uniref:Predicted protein n=1 Tax=Hordeum vulgare subsp. vulgare TaxID=112509 RepID=F2DU80_HORVV|nr:predicted protein [Hordeum vulgare subsp. vulgare]